MEMMQILEQVSERIPLASSAEKFRMAMLACHAAESGRQLDSSAEFDQLIQELTLQLSAHEDQYAAVAAEVDSLASTQPCHFKAQHLWTLVRAIKIQSQVLNLYLGPATASFCGNR